MSNIYRIKGSDTIVAMLTEPRRGVSFVKVVKRNGKPVRGHEVRNIPLDDLIPLKRRKSRPKPIAKSQPYFSQGSCPNCGASPESYRQGTVPCPSCGYPNESFSFKKWLVNEESA